MNRLIDLIEIKMDVTKSIDYHVNIWVTNKCLIGPLSTTMRDFWQMVIEQGSTLVVMVTTLVEKGRTKCHKYWPSLNECLELGSGAQLTCRSEEVDPTGSFITRDFLFTDLQVYAVIYLTIISTLICMWLSWYHNFILAVGSTNRHTIMYWLLKSGLIPNLVLPLSPSTCHTYSSIYPQEWPSLSNPPPGFHLRCSCEAF